MAKDVYVASIEGRSGKSLVALGLMEIAAQRVERVGFFRPVIRDGQQSDSYIELMRHRYGITDAPDRLYALTYSEARKLTEAGRTDEVLQRILASYEQLAANYDVMVVLGTDYTGVTSPFEFDFNAQIASHLGCVVFYVANGRRRDTDSIIESLNMARRQFQRQALPVVATVINRVQPAEAATLRARCAESWDYDDPVYVIPEDERLGKPTLADIMAALDGRLIHGDEPRLQNVATELVVADMRLDKVLDRLQSGKLVITSADRGDVVLGCLALLHSEACPVIAGVLLTGEAEPSASISRVIQNLRRSIMPIMRASADSYACAVAIEALSPAIGVNDERKIATALGLFEEHANAKAIGARLDVTRATTITPLRFEYELIERAKADRQHIVLPEGRDERILRAVEILLRRGVADLTVLGDPAEVQQNAAALGVDLQDVHIVDPAVSPWRDEFAQTYYTLRRHKGVNEDMARDAMSDVSYFSTMMVYTGRADGMVSGAAHTTAHTIRPALEFIRAREGVTVVSSVFLMCLEDRVLVYGDCAINLNPDAGQLADIAISSAETAAVFGIEPRVAMLSYSTGESGRGEDVDKVREATRLARERRPDLHIDGPLQYDAAVDASVALQKIPGSAVAGRATVFIFPDLNTGNNTYKAVQRSAGAVAIGPVLQGLRKPVNDLSRGCTVTDIVNTVAVTAIQAQRAG